MICLFYYASVIHLLYGDFITDAEIANGYLLRDQKKVITRKQQPQRLIMKKEKSLNSVKTITQSCIKNWLNRVLNGEKLVYT